MTRILQIGTDAIYPNNQLYFSMIICGNRFNLCHLCAFKGSLFESYKLQVTRLIINH